MKKLISILVSLLMMLTFTVPAFAADDEDSSAVLRIPEGTKVVTSDTVDDGVLDRLKVKTIYIPSSVTTVKSGALTKYANATTVYVDNSKDNVNIESGAFATGTAIVYTKATPDPEPEKTTTTTTTTKTTNAEDDDKDKEDDKSSTTKKTTTKKNETTKKKSTVSSSATTSNPKNRTTVQHRSLTIKSTKAKSTTLKDSDIPEVTVDPKEIQEEPDPSMELDTTTVTFAGEAITDKDGTIIGFEDPDTGNTSPDGRSSTARAVTVAAVSLVGLSAIGILALKLRRRP